MRSFATTLLLTAGLLLSLVPTAQATHFRYGTISWRPTSTTGTAARTIEFKLSVSYRYGYFGAPAVGANVNPGDVFNFGDNSSMTPTVKITSINTQEDYLIAEATFTHTYTANGNYTAFFGNCCRLSYLQNNHDTDYYLSAVVNVGTGNSSPVSSLVPIVNLATGLTNATFQIPANDPNGSPLSFSLATGNDLKVYNSPTNSLTSTAPNAPNSFSQPAGLSISRSGLVTFNTVGKPTSTTYLNTTTNTRQTVPVLYNTVVKISDGTSQILVDFLIKIVPNTGVSPTFVYGGVTPNNGAIIQTTVGSSPITFPVRATDPDPGDVVTLQASGLPVNATFPPVSGTATATGTFSFTPTVVGTSVITFSAVDNIGHQAITSVTIQVCNPINPSVVASNNGALTCSTQSLTLTATGGGGTQYVFLGPDEFNQSGTDNKATVTQAGTYTVIVSGNNSCPTSITTAVVSNTVAPGDLTLNTSGSLTCAQTSVVLTAGSSTTGVSYVFNGPGITGQSSNTATVNKPGTYTVVSTGTNGCVASTTTSVSSNTALPTVSIIPSSTAICAGQSTTLTAAGADTYTWSIGGQTTASISVSASGPYSVTGTASNGCSNTATASVTVNPLPTVSITPSSTVICAGQAVTLSATAGLSNYQWSTTQTTSAISVSVAGAYSVTVTDANGCSNTATASVTVNPLPTVSITPSSTAICAGQSVTLMATSGLSSYKWSTTQTTSAISVSVAGPYSVTVTDANGCSNTATASITVNPLPTVSITPSSTAICAGQTVTLSATAGLSSYKWSTTQTTSAISVSVAGAYSVTVTDANGCSNTAAASVTVNPLPTPTIVGLVPAYCQDAAPVSLTGSPTGGTFTIDGTTASILSSTSLSLGQHTVAYSYTNNNGCSNVASQTVTVKETPQAPVIVTQSGHSYPAGVSNLTINRNVGDVILTVSGCANGSISWNGGNSTTLAVSTFDTGVQTFTALCTTNGCTSPLATATVTVLPTTFSVFHRDGNGQLNTNTLSPYLQLQNDGNTAIPYSEITVRYWLTVENYAPLLFSINYAQLGSDKVHLRYVPATTGNSTATGYIEFSFDASAGSLGAMSNSGPIQDLINKQDYSFFDQSNDYSYAPVGNFTPNERITAYRNGVIIYGHEPMPVVPTQSLKAQLQNNTAADANSIVAVLQVLNDGNQPVNYGDLKVRYYFTADGPQPLVLNQIGYTALGAANVTGQLVTINPPLANADTYLEVSFSPSLGSLAPGASTGTVTYEIRKSDYSGFNQNNDYSYQGTGGMMLNQHVVVYLAGQKVYGTEPGTGGRLSAEEVATPLRVQVLGNPLTGSALSVSVQGSEGQRLRYELTDGGGRLVSERQVERAAAVDEQTWRLEHQPSGLLLLRVSTPAQTKTVKVLKAD